LGQVVAVFRAGGLVDDPWSPDTVNPKHIVVEKYVSPDPNALSPEPRTPHCNTVALLPPFLPAGTEMSPDPSTYCHIWTCNPRFYSYRYRDVPLSDLDLILPVVR